MSEQTITVLYHANCPDGFGAAFACWQHFGNQAQYLPVSYGNPPPAIPKGHAVYIVDFSYPEETLRAMHGKGHVVKVLDHHASAERDLKVLQDKPPLGIEVYFNMEESGATLTWWHLNTWPQHPNPPKWMPKLFKYIRDRDLWRWELPHGREISMVLRTLPQHFESWQLFMHELEDERTFSQVITRGQAICTYADQLMAEQAKRATWRTLQGHTVPVVNATTLFSEVGDTLCKAHPEAPFVAYYFDRSDNKRQWGLRSRGGFDCSVVAKAYGGGGHPGAAGFVTELGWLPNVVAEAAEVLHG